MPAPLRAIVRGLASMATKGGDAATSQGPEAGRLRPEPVLSMKTIVLAIGLAALLLVVARLVL